MTDDYLTDYEEFWKEIVEVDGVLDIDQVKRELFDFHNIMREAAKVYDHVTGGRLSHPLHYAANIIMEADEHYQRLFEEEE